MLREKIFNRGIASGEAFCNRVAETQQLVRNIDNLTHTLLISPRRYGKTSLALHAMECTPLPYVYIDLFLKYKTDEVLDEFYQGVGQLMGKFIKPSEKAVRKIESLIKHVSVSLKLGKFGFELALAPKTADSKKNLKTLLVSLDELLAEQQQRAIIFIDEIQTISELDICDEVESALRFVAQKTKHISFIFSGSSRHLIGKMFDDRSRPLYKLCQKITLDRIKSEHYRSFINTLSKRQWGRPLVDDVLQAMFDVTECHPYYVNILCAYLFQLECFPEEVDVIDCWEKIAKEEQSSVAKDIEFLTGKQKQLISAIAKHPHLKEPTAKNFVQKINLTPRGILNAIKVLLKHDIVERLTSDEIRIVDPVLKYWLR